MAKQICTEGLEEGSGRVDGSRFRKSIILGKWRETEASPVTICSLVQSINPAICVMHTVLLQPLQQRSSVLTHIHTNEHMYTHPQMDMAHLMSSTPLSPICLRLLLCSSLSCADNHGCHSDTHKQTERHTSTITHTLTHTHTFSFLFFASYSSQPLFSIVSHHNQHFLSIFLFL